jgi:hypothetical protein
LVLFGDSSKGFYFQDIQEKSGPEVFIAQEGDQIRTAGDDFGLLAMLREES